jgi:phage-related protein
MTDKEVIKPVILVGTSKKDLKSFPRAVTRDIGQAIYAAQSGGKDPAAKPMKGFKPKVMEIVAPHDTDTYRAVYTVKLGYEVFVLHAFQKKAKKGRATPRMEVELIKQRLKEAIEIYKERQN